jgi:hypothetical protein
MIVNKRSLEAIKARIQQPFIVSGFDPNDSVLSEIIGAIVEALGTHYSDIYSLENNTKITTASIDYLENHYGVILDEPRSSISYIDVNDLSSIYITLIRGEDEARIPARSITRDGEGILIPKNTPILSKTFTPLMVTKNSVKMVEDTIYITATAIDRSVSYIPANSLAFLEFDLAAVPNINPSLISNVSLRVRNIIDLKTETTEADVGTYRYVLQQKAASINLTNDAKLSTIFDILSIRNYHIDRINYGSTSMVVYIDTTSYENEDAVITQVDRHISEVLYGVDIRVRPFIKRYAAPRYKITYQNSDLARETKNEIASTFSNIINATSPGSTIDFNTVTEELKTRVKNIGAIELDKLFIDGKELSTTTYRVSNIERIVSIPEQVVFIS